MKYISVIILPLLLILLPHKGEKEDLYLLYSSHNSRMGKGYMIDDERLTFVYEIVYREETYINIGMTEFDSCQRDTIDFENLSMLDLKDVDWLTQAYLKYFNYFKGKDPKVDPDGTLRVFNLNKQYDSVFVVMPDSSKGKAVITKVKHDLYFSID